MAFPVAFVNFVSDAAKDAGAIEAVNGMWDLMLANLAPGVVVDTGKIVHYDSRTGLPDPNGGGWDYSFPDTSDHRLPLPPAELVSSLTAITDGLESLTTPPNGCGQSAPVQATPPDPGMQFGMTEPSSLNWELPYINIFHQVGHPHTDDDDYPLFLQSGGYMDANANMINFTPTTFILEETHFNRGVGFTQEARDASLNRYVLRWDGAGNVNFRYSPWTDEIGSGSGKSAVTDWNLGSLADTQMTAVPVLNRICAREGWLDIHDAGQHGNPDLDGIHGEVRITRYMDATGTNNSFMTSVAQMPPESYLYWSHPTDEGQLGVRYNYAGPPLSVIADECNRRRTHCHFCIHEFMDDASVLALATFFKNNLDPDLALLPEFSNETWNSIFDVFTTSQLRGLKLFNVVNVLSGTGYAADDQVYVRDGANTIDAATNADPGVFTYTESVTISGDDIIYLSGFTGMTEVNGGYYQVRNHDKIAKTFTLRDAITLETLDTSAFGTYTGGGTLELCIWVMKIETVDGSGVPDSPISVIRRSRPTLTTGITVTGGAGTGLTVTIDVYEDDDFPTKKFSAFRSAEMMNIIKGVYGADFLIKCRPVLAIQTRRPGDWVDAWKVGFDHFMDGMPGHADYPTGPGLAFDETYWAICGTNYIGPTLTGTLNTDALGWLASGGQAEFEAQIVVKQQADLDVNLASCAEWRLITDSLGVLFGTYEGQQHLNQDGAAASVIVAQNIYLKSVTGRDFLLSAMQQFAQYYHWLTDFNLVGTATSGNPWYATDEASIDTIGLQMTFDYNRDNPGSVWDTISAGVDFSVGPSYGIRTGEQNPCTDIIMFGGRCSQFNGDGTNLAIMVQEGNSVNAAETWVDGVLADYTVDLNGPNGATVMKRAGVDFYGNRFHPTKGGMIRFMGDYSTIAVSAL